MPTRSNRRPDFLPGPARFALALMIVVFAASDAQAGHDGPIARCLNERNRRFYGPEYNATGYADSLGLRGHKRSENGGYYGPPQIYSRQYGTVAGYRTARPFTPPRAFGGTGYGGNAMD